MTCLLDTPPPPTPPPTPAATLQRLSPLEVARQTDCLLRTLARENVLVGRLLGQGLVRLATDDGFAALGYSCLENYAAQRLDMSGRAAQELAWMERRLPRYPAVEEAYAQGTLSFSHARLLLRRVRPEDELLWAEAASRMSVAELEQALEFWKERGAPAQEEAAGTYPLRAPDEEPHAPHRIGFVASPALKVKMDLAAETTRRMHGADLPLGACLEFWMAEFLAGEGGAVLATLEDESPETDDVPGEVLPWRVPNVGSLRRLWREVEIGLSEMSAHWAALNWEVPPLPAPPDLPEGNDAAAIDRHLVAVQHRAHEREVCLMELLALLADYNLFADLDFTGLRHYVSERLAMSPRAAWFLLSLHRRLKRLPRVREAYEAGVLTKAQADLVGQVAVDATQAAWIAHARHVTLKVLRQDVQAALRMRDLDGEGFARTGGLPEPEVEPDGATRTGGGYRPPAVQARAADAQPGSEPHVPSAMQACAAAAGPADDDSQPTLHAADVYRLPAREQLRMFRRGDLDEVEPGPAIPVRFMLAHDLVEMWRDIYRACRAIFGPTVSVADCVEICVDAFLSQWAPAALVSMREHQTLDRDGWICANPTCTRRASLHAHHMVYRSHGGALEAFNQVTLCRICHLRLVHRNRVRVQGVAPHHVSWDLGVAPDRAPHLRVFNRRIVGGAAGPAPAPAVGGVQATA